MQSTYTIIYCWASSYTSSTALKSPTLSLFTEYLSVKSNEIGVIVATSTLVGIIVNVTASALSDIYDRRKLPLASVFLCLFSLPVLTCKRVLAVNNC